MKLLVAGAGGQVGAALVRLARAAGHDVMALTRAALDITDPRAVDAAVDEVAGGAAINAAAFTSVDRAETDPAGAFAVNRSGAAHLARACAARGVRLVHISTDHVFDGTRAGACREDDPVSPVNVYGASKAEGEAAVAAANPAALIVRTSWVFSADGSNFVTSIARLALEQRRLRVVADQRGCPTFAGDLARALLELAARAEDGVLHFCGEGETSRHGFAEAIVAAARARGPIAAEEIEAIASAEQPGAARRPPRVVLDTGRIRSLGIEPRPWRAGLDEVMDGLATSTSP